MKHIALAALFAAALLSSAPVLAKAHHTPMAVPIDCHGDFACLHPGYLVAAADRNTITSWWGGIKSVTVCSCGGRVCHTEPLG